MADETSSDTAVTRPVRKRSKDTAKSTKPAKAINNSKLNNAADVVPDDSTQPAPAAVKSPTRTDITRFRVTLDKVRTTKSYVKFTVPDNMNGVVVGSIYAPMGTARVVILIVSEEDSDTANS
jgi:hypothetical protein